MNTTPSIKYYTNVSYSKNKLHVRGFDDNGKSVCFDVDYQPTVWVPLNFNLAGWKREIVSLEHHKWKCLIDDEPLVGVKFKNIAAARYFVQKNVTMVLGANGTVNRTTNVHTAPNNMFVSQYIAENFPGDCHISADKLKIYTYDIETEIGHRNVDDDSEVTCRTKADDDSSSVTKRSVQQKTMTIAEFETMPDNDKFELLDESTGMWVDYKDHPYRYIGGFPDPNKAEEKITLITVKDINSNKIDTWGLEEFVNNRPDVVTYHRFSNEKDLLQDFVDFIASDYPHAMTGWNSSAFDNTYVANRVKNVLGVEQMNRLSPYQEIEFKQVEANEFGNTVTETTWKGISNLDYLKLYKKFTYGQKDSYKLDAIAEFEIGIKKVENPTGGSFKDFYTGSFDVRSKPDESDNQIRKLGYIRTQLHNSLKTHPENRSKYQLIDAKIKKMCKQLFIEYNIRDVELVDKIDAKQKFLDLIMTIAYYAHCNYEDVFSPVRTWDYIIFNHLNQSNTVIPIKKNASKSEKFPGAYVKSPLVGKHEFCESFDLD